MSRFEAKCPSCGAAVAFESSISMLAVCAYCKGLVLRDADKVRLLGKAGELLQDASPVQLGVTGVHQGRAFTVIGRLQLTYEKGSWNEWFLDFGEERGGWLAEAQGLYGVTFYVKTKDPLPERRENKLGRWFTLDGREWVARDIVTAHYSAAEGQLPFFVPFDKGFDFVDLAGGDCDFATIDYSEDPPLFFAGQYAPFESFQFKGLRSFEGW